ncbi:oxidoreductase [Streptomyces sp. NPDC053048]|uniref:oxidoreductase n=1 Tax=Streptomyces sp. NPDC053048 TaxID=3365694 RepID=UPI0037D7C29E
MLTATSSPAGNIDAANPLAALNPLVALTERSVTDVERLHRLTPELAEAITDAGFARHFVPRRWGGTAGTFTAALWAVAAVGETCASTSWCAALYAAHGRLAAYLPEAAQYELWGDTPDVRIAAAVVPPAGEATATDGGWRLAGRWSYASGVDHAHWILLSSLTGTGAERVVRVFALPRAAVEVLDTWRNAGLKGTGSHVVVVDDAFVPGHRTFTLPDLARTDPGAARCHAIPYQLVAGLQFAAPVLGAAHAALRNWTAGVAARRGPDGSPASPTAGARRTLALASAEIHAAGLMLEAAAHRADAAEVTPVTVAENVRDASAAVHQCATAVGRLMKAAGARAQAEGDPLQRRWRDVTAAAAHGALGFEAAADHYAQAVLGAEGAR